MAHALEVKAPPSFLKVVWAGVLNEEMGGALMPVFALAGIYSKSKCVLHRARRLILGGPFPSAS